MENLVIAGNLWTVEPENIIPPQSHNSQDKEKRDEKEKKDDRDLEMGVNKPVVVSLDPYEDDDITEIVYETEVNPHRTVVLEPYEDDITENVFETDPLAADTDVMDDTMEVRPPSAVILQPCEEDVERENNCETDMADSISQIASIQQDEDLKDILPKNNYKYKILSVEKEDNNGLRLQFALNVKTKDEAKTWLKCFQEHTKTTYTVQTTRPTTKTLIVWKCYYKCHHNTRSKNVNSETQPNVKNTNCPSKMTVTIRAVHKRWQGKSLRNKPDPEMPCVIDLDYNHNHPVGDYADVLRFRPVSDKTREKLTSLYRKGYSPLSALMRVKRSLEEENPETLDRLLADRHHCPDYQFCYRLFMKEFNKQYGPASYEETIQFLSDKIVPDFNRENKCIEMAQGKDFLLVAICTPFMRRAHALLREAGELVFVDSTGNLDREGHRVFQFMTHTEAGGVPLGIVITSSESLPTVISGFAMLKTLMGDDCFYGRGPHVGPQNFITDDSRGEKHALKVVWPSTVQFLCIFHVLHFVWQWLMSSDHGVSKEHRQTLYRLFKNILYSASKVECTKLFCLLKRNKIARRYPTFLNYMDDLWKRQNEWALYHRNETHALVRGIHTNNFLVASIRTLKDKILEGVKALNIVQLVYFILARLDKYYAKKFLDAAHGRGIKRGGGRWRSYRRPSLKLIQTQISSCGDDEYLVQGDTGNTYRVNVSNDTCTCAVGATGAPCKHQFWVQCTRSGDSSRKAAARQHIYYRLATGNVSPPEWLVPLHSYISSSLPSPPSQDSLRATAAAVSPAGPSSATSLETMKNEGERIIRRIGEKMLHFLNVSPDVVLPSLQSMESQLDAIKTCNALSSNLMMFGKYAFSKKRKGTMIAVQPSAISRRKTEITGRRKHPGGRPLMGHANRQPAPHDLEECVKRNVRLGGGHKKITRSISLSHS